MQNIKKNSLILILTICVASTVFALSLVCQGEGDSRLIFSDQGANGEPSLFFKEYFFSGPYEISISHSGAQRTISGNYKMGLKRYYVNFNVPELNFAGESFETTVTTEHGFGRYDSPKESLVMHCTAEQL